VDQSRFQEAQQAYDSGDFRVAAKGFLAAATRGADGNGTAYHMAGNALMRLRRYQDAVTVYGHALRDSIYDRRGAVWANLGSAHVELGDYAEAARAYERAIEEPDYQAAYRAYQGMAGALLERGRVEEAAVAYRKAALDPGNPDPGKALVNLGLCFMALGRASDAVEAYRAALGFDQYQGRGKALANLGQAYVVLGEYDEADKAFEKATELHSHKLSPAANAAWTIAREQLAPEVSAHADEGGEAEFQELSAERPTVTADAASDADLVAAQTTGNWATGLTDAWTTSEIAGSGAIGWSAPTMPHTPEPVTPPNSSAQSTESAEEVAAELARPVTPLASAGREADLGIGDEKAVADFFSVSEEELKERGRAARRAERHAKRPSMIIRAAIGTAITLVVVSGVLIGAYQLGYGWPTQTQTVGYMMTSYQGGTSVAGYWVAAPAKDIGKEMAKIPPVKSFVIDSVAQGATTSSVAITVTPRTGAALHYTITLSREGVGWKVSGVDNDWRSTGG
jgi:tetratricopeptide (TPR) repeat protein